MFKNILVLAPHTDDGEFGCGGTMVKFLEAGLNVWYIVFSSAEDSVPKEFARDCLKKEVKNATQKLGLDPSKLILYDYPVRNFPEFRQKILDDLIILKNKLNPDLVFLPCSFDIHQDHKTIYEEGLRAFKFSSILGYEIPWNNLVFETKSFVYLEQKQVDRKIEALSCYKSQLGKHYMDPDFVRSKMRARGGQAGVQYTEAFEVIRWVIKSL